MRRMLGQRNDPSRWVDERFLRVACDAMGAELDWDSLDSGCLHRATSIAKTLEGIPIIVGVMDQPERLAELLEDAVQDRRDNGLLASTPLWLYVPMDFPLPQALPVEVVAKRL